MKRIYKTAIGHSVTELDNNVEKYLMAGYQLYGNPYTSVSLFCQAVIYVEEDKHEELPPIKLQPNMIEGNA